VARPYFDECLTRQFNRLKKAGVKTTTYIETHLRLLTLVLPREPLEKVIQAKGDFSKVTEEVQELLSAGPLGKSLFSFAGLHANAAQYQKAIDGLLDELMASGVSNKSIEKFKEEAAARATAFKASGIFIPSPFPKPVVCVGCHAPPSRNQWYHNAGDGRAREEQDHPAKDQGHGHQHRHQGPHDRVGPQADGALEGCIPRGIWGSDPHGP
jgi:hypothetical protein